MAAVNDDARIIRAHLRHLRTSLSRFALNYQKRQYETKRSLILSLAIFDCLENSRAAARCERTKRFHFVASARVSRFATLCQHVAQQRLTNAGRRKVKTKPLESSSARGYCLIESSRPMTKPFPILTASSPGFCARKLVSVGKVDQASFSGRLYTATASAVQDFKPQIAGFVRKTLVPPNEQRYSTHAYTRDVGTKSGRVRRQGSRTDIRLTPGSRLLNPSPGFFPPSCNSEHSGR